MKKGQGELTICPAPMTPRRFTSAAGRAAVELKYLARPESRSACRADMIAAAIVAGKIARSEVSKMEVPQ
jgi:hypothetical protein